MALPTNAAPKKRGATSSRGQCPEASIDLRQLLKSGCAPENRALVVALSEASAEEQRMWFSAANAWLESQDVRNLAQDALLDFAQFVYVRVAQDNDQLFGEFVAKLCKMAEELQPYGSTMLQALAHAFHSVNPDSLQNNVPSLQGVARNLLQQMDVAGPTLHEAEFAAVHFTQQAYLATILLLQEVLPSLQSKRDGRLYQYVRQELKQVVQATQKLPVYNCRQLLRQVFEVLVDCSAYDLEPLGFLQRWTRGMTFFYETWSRIVGHELNGPGQISGIACALGDCWCQKRRSCWTVCWEDLMHKLEDQVVACVASFGLEETICAVSLQEVLYSSALAIPTLIRGCPLRERKQSAQSSMRWMSTIRLKLLALEGDRDFLRQEGLQQLLAMCFLSNGLAKCSHAAIVLLDCLAVVAAGCALFSDLQKQQAMEVLSKLEASLQRAQVRKLCVGHRRLQQASISCPTLSIAVFATWLSGDTLQGKMFALQKKVASKSAHRSRMKCSIFASVVRKIGALRTESLAKRELKCLNILFDVTERARLHQHWQDRSRVLGELQRTLRQHQVCVVAGRPGVGKGSLVAHYSQNIQGARSVLWIRAATKVGVVQELHKLSYYMGVNQYCQGQNLACSPSTYCKRLTSAVFGGLPNRTYTLLLIFVEPKEPRLVADCVAHLPAHAQVIVITENSSAFKGWWPLLQVEPFTAEEGREFLRRSMKAMKRESNRQQLRSLMEVVGTVPLRLSLTLGYLTSSPSTSMEDYVHQLRELEGDNVVPEVYLSVSLLDVRARLLMRYAAYLDGDFIPLSLVGTLLQAPDCEHLHTVLQPLFTLQLASAVKRKEETLGLQVHQSVQGCFRQSEAWKGIEGMDEATILSQVVQTLQSIMPGAGQVENSSQKSAFLYAPHVLAVLPYLEAAGLSGSQGQFYLMCGLGRFFSHLLQSDLQAAEFFAPALDVSESAPGLSPTDIASCLYDMGNSQRMLYHFQSALEYHRRALLLRRQVFQGSHSDTAYSLREVGKVLGNLDQHNDSLQYHLQSLEMFRNMHGKNHRLVADSLICTAIALHQVGRLQESLQYREEALEIRRALAKEESWQVGNAHWNVGTAYRALGQYSKEMEHISAALDIYVKVYGNEGPDVSWLNASMGWAKYNLGQFHEALEYWVETWKFWSSTYEGDHDDVVNALCDVGCGRYVLGEYSAANDRYMAALQMTREACGESHHSTGLMLNNVACTQYQLGNYTQALKLIGEAMEEYNKTQGLPHSRALAQCNKGRIYHALGQHSQSLDWLSLALEKRKSLHDGRHPSVAVTLLEIGKVHNSLSQHDEAIGFLEAALDIFAEFYQQGDIDTGSCLSVAAIAYANLGNHDKAVDYAIRALAMIRTVFKKNHPDVAQALHNLGMVFLLQEVFDLALENCCLALHMRRVVYGNEHPVVGDSLRAVGQAYEGQGRLLLAEEYYRQSLAVQQAAYGTDHPATASAQRRVSGLFEESHVD